MILHISSEPIVKAYGLRNLQFEEKYISLEDFTIEETDIKDLVRVIGTQKLNKSIVHYMGLHGIDLNTLPDDWPKTFRKLSWFEKWVWGMSETVYARHHCIGERKVDITVHKSYVHIIH